MVPMLRRCQRIGMASMLLNPAWSIARCEVDEFFHGVPAPPERLPRFEQRAKLCRNGRVTRSNRGVTLSMQGGFANFSCDKYRVLSGKMKGLSTPWCKRVVRYRLQCLRTRQGTFTEGGADIPVCSIARNHQTEMSGAPSWVAFLPEDFGNTDGRLVQEEFEKLSR